MKNLKKLSRENLKVVTGGITPKSFCSGQCFNYYIENANGNGQCVVGSKCGDGYGTVVNNQCCF